LTTYIAGSLPAIKAADLMAFQTAINRAFLGTYSYFGLVLDGVGGANATPTAGGLTTSGPIVSGGPVTVGGTSVGTAAPTPTPQRGALYKDSLVFAFGFFYANATMAWGMNIASVAHPSAGNFTVTLINGSAGNPASIVPVACAYGGAYSASAAVATANTINVVVFNSAGNIDEPFYLIVVGA
jgi:hypothetical protein